jgi:outer membrane protein assembly factor BamB
MVDPYDYDADGRIVEWISEFPEGGLSFSPVITEDGIIFIATTKGPIYAYDSRDGALLGWRYLTADKQVNLLAQVLDVNDCGFFVTVNAPCVRGSRVYMLTHYKQGVFLFPHYARLYAIDVDPYNPNMEDRLKIAWYYEFGGPSGASPLLINNTLYFDGNRSFLMNPYIYAVTDMGNYGKDEWKKAFPTPIDASFALDPRGGFWIVDAWGGRLAHHSTEDGSVIEEIDVDGLVQEPGRHKPSSVITMCGNETRPILIVSATAIKLFRSSSYVIAIDLAADNSLLWKVKISDGSLFSLDFPFGQYPVLMKNGEPRVVFSTIRDGVWAIGAASPSQNQSSGQQFSSSQQQNSQTWGLNCQQGSQNNNYNQ